MSSLMWEFILEDGGTNVPGMTEKNIKLTVRDGGMGYVRYELLVYYPFVMYLYAPHELTKL